MTTGTSESGHQNVLVDFEDGIAWVTMNRPDKRNAINPGLVCVDDDLLKEADLLLGKLRTNSVSVLSAVKTFLNRQAEMSPAARREAAALINCVVTAERYR